MHIAVIGAGALGTLFGGRLAAAGHEVWLLHRRESAARDLDERGVRIESSEGTTETTVNATTDAAEAGEADLALVVVKSYQTREALSDHAACIGPETRVLTLQNGLRNRERLAEIVGDERALAGVTYQGARLDEPGVVVHTSDGPTVVGGPDRAFAGRIETAFESAGFETEAVGDPRPHVWEKQLWGIAIKPLAALTRLTNGELVADDDLAAVMERSVAEARRVADARGIDLPAGVVDELRRFLDGSDHRSSMLQDVLAGRPTEIEAINAAVVDLAAEEGIEAPTNAMLVALVRGLERGYLDGDPREGAGNPARKGL